MDQAQEINAIYERGAPIASTVMTKFAADFVQEIRALIHQAIIDNGGRLEAQTIGLEPKSIGTGSSPAQTTAEVSAGGV